MQNAAKTAILSIKDGLYVCPSCRHKTQQAADEATSAQNLRLWCRSCKAGFIVDIDHGRGVIKRRYH